MAKKKADPEAAPPTEPTAAPPAENVEYTVLARRYRPGQFKDLAGQDAVSQALSNALKSNRVAHAYLFTGARGVGKTSTARILAKCLNCEKGPTITPCDVCERCQMISVGEDTDVLEIDGATNNGVDQVRELRANVQYRPQRSRYKIYIIDEVHMLTTQAFNGLLKTLEEPPSHVKFIFATTEATKIPITILSRCQRFDFASMNMATLRERLKHIVASEGREADDEAIELIARRAAGSMRDGQSLLDQLLAFGNDRLTTDRVHQLLGTANEDRVLEIAAAVVAKDARKALELLSDFVDHGQQLGELLDQLIEYWRDLMIVQAAGIEGQTLSVSSSNHKQLLDQAKNSSPDTILAGLDILVSAKTRMKFTAQGRIVMEMALVRLARLDQLVSLSQLTQWVQEGGGAPVRPAGSAPAGSAPAGSSPAGEAEKKKPLANGSAPPAEVNKKAQHAHLPFREESLQTIWKQLLSQCGFALNGDLRRATNIAISGPNTLVLTFPARYNLREDQLLEASRKTQAEEVLAKILGLPVQIRVVISQEEKGNLPASLAETDTSSLRRMREELVKKPLVKQATEVLGAQIIHVDPGFGVERPKPNLETDAEEPLGEGPSQEDDDV